MNIKVLRFAFVFFVFMLFFNFYWQNFKKTLDNDDKDILKVSDCYSEVLRMYPTADINNEIRLQIKDLNHRWEKLNGTVHETMKNVTNNLVCF